MEQKMAFLTQSRFPWLWEQYMFWMGGTVAKRKLAKFYIRDHHRTVLEVGCSVGNVGQTFLQIPGIQYTGIDIDLPVIKRAQQKFKRMKNARFICEDVVEFAKTGEKFDYIVYPSMLHHCDDATCESLLRAGTEMIATEGDIVISDQLLPEPEDTLYMKFMAKMERGKYVRTKGQLVALINGFSFLTVKEFSVYPVALNPFFSWPVGCYNALFRCKPR